MTAPQVPTGAAYHGVRRIAWALLALTAWPLLFEAGIRVDDWVRYGTPFFSPFRTQAQLMVRDAEGIHGRPNARFRKWILNAEGLRGPETTQAKPAGVLRLITIGASETFGLYENPGREYPRQLEDSLEAMREDGRCRCVGITRFEVLNGALPGMGLPTVAQDVRNRLHRYSPDAMVLYPSPVQYLDELMPEAARPDSSPGANRPLGFRDGLYPRAIGRLRDQLKVSLPGVVKDYLRRRDAEASRTGRPAGWEFRRIPQERVDGYARDLAGALAGIRDAGATPFVVTHANAFAPSRPRDASQLTAWGRFYPRALPDVILAFDDSAATITADVARRAAVPLVDWHAAANRQQGTLFQDFVHMTDRGAGILAGELARQVVQWADSARHLGAAPAATRVR